MNVIKPPNPKPLSSSHSVSTLTTKPSAFCNKQLFLFIPPLTGNILFLLKGYIKLMPQYHVVLCDVEGEGAGQTGNKQYLLFKVKGLAYVGMKSNSIIAKNLFNHFFISVLSPFTAIIVPTTESKWKQIMVFATSSCSQYVFPSRIQSSSITGGLGMFFAALPPLFLCLDSLTAVCQCSSPKDW